MRAFEATLVLTAAYLAGFASGAASQEKARVLSGGVGLESREELKRVSGDYNLHLGFAAKDGVYLAGVEVRIEDARGQTVWSGVSEGPFLYASLPPGRYQVTAAYNGQPIKRTVQVGPKAGAVHYLRW